MPTRGWGTVADALWRAAPAGLVAACAAARTAVGRPPPAAGAAAAARRAARPRRRGRGAAPGAGAGRPGRRPPRGAARPRAVSVGGRDGPRPRKRVAARRWGSKDPRCQRRGGCCPTRNFDADSFFHFVACRRRNWRRHAPGMLGRVRSGGRPGEGAPIDGRPDHDTATSPHRVSMQVLRMYSGG